MRVVIFTVCQSAVIEGGSLNISRAFSNLYLPGLPRRCTFSIVTRLFFCGEEEGSFSGFLRLTDPDGQEIHSAPVELKVPASKADETGVFIDAIGAMDVTFRKTGEFQFHLDAGNGQWFEVPLYVALSQSSSGRS